MVVVHHRSRPKSGLNRKQAVAATVGSVRTSLLHGPNRQACRPEGLSTVARGRFEISLGDWNSGCFRLSPHRGRPRLVATVKIARFKPELM
jgi:hypothetical protein